MSEPKPPVGFKAPRLGLEQRAREADVALEMAKLHAQAEGESARAAPSRSRHVGGDGPYQLRAGGRPSARALELRTAERRGRSGRGARALDGPRIIRRRGGDGCGRPASAGGIVLRRYDRSGSDSLSGTIREGDSSSRLASSNAWRIFSITVISVFIAVRLSWVPAHCSSLLESPFERTVRCRAVFRMASEASFRWTASSVNVSRSMIMVCSPLANRVAKPVP